MYKKLAEKIKEQKIALSLVGLGYVGMPIEAVFDLDF